MLKWINRHLIRILLPIFIVAVVIGAVKSDQEKIGCTNAATGTVIEVNIKTRQEDSGKYNKGERRRLHTPTILYIADGKAFEEEFSGSIEPIWEVGQEVQILYNPDKPKVSILPEERDGYASRYTNGSKILLGFVCIVFLVVSFCIGTWIDNNRQRSALEKQAKKESAIEPQKKKLGFKTYVKVTAMFLSFFIYMLIIGRLGERSILFVFAGISLPAMAILGTLCYLLVRQDRNEKKQCSVCVVGHPSRRFSVKDGYNGSDSVRMKFQYQAITYCDQDGVKREVVSPGGFSLRKGQTTVKVWYNPKNPDEAVIEGTHRFQWGAMGSIIFMFVYVFGAIFLAALGHWWPVIVSFPFVFIGFWIFLLKLMNPK